ncbi:MAG: hypothetical protein EBZ59_10685, partial [Planctomycetia bacterium]|nr:hypothetical protein [Planctomycetia bacterium]
MEARLAKQFPTLAVQVQGASLVEGEGIVVRGVSLVDPGVPQQWRQVLWIDEVRLACTTSLTELACGPPRIGSMRLRRPVVHAVRDRDGTWNVGKLLAGRPAGGLVPVAVEDATLLVDDRLLEMRATMRQVGFDVQPAADASAPGWAVVRGSLAGDLFERIAFEGRVSPTEGRFEIRGSVESLDITPRLLAMLPAPAAAVGDGTVATPQERLAGLRGRVHLDWRAAGSLRAFEQVEFDVSGRLESGRFEHASIPFAMSDLSADFRADRSGLSVERIEAHSGSTLLRGSGRSAGWRSESDFELLVEAERLTVGRQWEGLLPQPLAAQWRKLLPAGEVDVRAQVVRRNGGIDPKVSVRCRNVSLTHYRFPYRLDRTVGTVVLNGRELTMHLTGQAGGHAVQVDGTFRTDLQTAAGFVEVRGDGMRIDDGLLAAMPPRSADILRSLRAAGTFDFVFRHERSPRLPGGHINTLGIRLSQCSLSYAGFPYPLSNVSGSLRMEAGHWTIRDVTGSNDTGTVRCSGTLVPRGEDDGELTLHLAGTGVVLERELRDALPQGMRRIWDDVDPRGNAEFTATVRHRVKMRRTEVELEATPHGDTVSIEPAWFPYRLERLGGRLVWRDGLLRFEGVRGVHARTTVAAEGVCRFTPDGGWHVSFARLSADRFRADHDVLQALPDGLQRAIAAVRPRGLLSLNGSLDIYSTAAGPPAGDLTPGGTGVVAAQVPGPPAAGWDLHLDMEQGSLDVGVQLEHVHGGVRLKGQSDGRIWQASGDVAIDSAMWRGMQVTAVQGPLAMDAAGVRFGVAAGGSAGQATRRLSARVAGGTLLVDGS